MATIRNRNGRWHVQVRKTGSTSINRTFSLKSDAQFWAREKERELELEGYVKPNTELLSHRLHKNEFCFRVQHLPANVPG